MRAASHEVRASDDDGLASGELYAVALEELDHTVRGARQETRQADGEPPTLSGLRPSTSLAGCSRSKA